MLRIALEEIVVKCFRDFKQEFSINPLTLENLVNIEASTVYLLRQPRNFPALLIKLGAYKFSYVNLFCHPIPRRTCKTKKALNRFYFAIITPLADQSIANNKRKRFTPDDVNFADLLRLLKNWSFSRRMTNPSDSVCYISKKMEDDFSPSSMFFPYFTGIFFSTSSRCLYHMSTVLISTFSSGE